MDKVTSILLVGVGGQGTILASKLFSEAMAEEGFDVKMSEIHGMSQRGGGVSTQIRYGKKVYSPIIGEGCADILVSMETAESARWLNYLKPDAKLIISDYRIYPPEVLSGREEYPQTTIEDLSKVADVTVVHAEKLALEAGSAKCMNIVLLGALVKGLGLENSVDWNGIIEKTVKPAFIEMNKKAFRLGVEAVS
jgi:indolepyruvate ferredoxin oxidoreductase beta subunit